MKYLLFSFITFVAFDFSYSQLQVPQLSPRATYQQIVGLTQVTIEYSRPSVRGRKIFGGLVPYDNIWRTGANQNSIITFNDDVVFGGIDVPKGSYAIYTRPGKTQWQVYLYDKTDNWGLPNPWDEELIVAQIEVQSTELKSSLESFTLGINELHNDGGSLYIVWDKTLLAIPFLVPTAEKAKASIEKTLAGTPTGNDYYQAASYYQQEGLDLEKALGWLEKAINENADRYWYHRPKALILADLGRYQEAIQVAENSLKLAENAGNTDYVRLNQDSIDQWSKNIEQD